MPGSQVLLTEKEPIRLERSHVRRFCFEDDDELTFRDQEWQGPHDSLFEAVTEDDEEVVLEFVQRLPQGIRVQVSGTEYDVSILTPREHELSSHMIPKEEIDLSKSLLSPMPCALVSVAVEVGDEVEPGQELAVVEAMKMQNVLRAEQKGKVKGVVASAGSSLEVDQLILEFE